MHNFDTLMRAYQRQVHLPWRDDVPSAARVWMLWYDKSLELRVQGQWAQFEAEAHRAGHGWTGVDMGALFGPWLDSHELRNELLEEPDQLSVVLPEFEAHVVDELGNALAAASPNDLVAVQRCGALYGLASLSNIISKVEDGIRGRLLLAFAGRYEGTGYRLLDGRRGWNYHAIPIPPEPVA